MLLVLSATYLSFRASEAVALAPGADAVSETIDFFFALAVNRTRNETVKERPADNGGSCCRSGFARTPFGALRRREPTAEPPVPLLITLTLTDRHFPGVKVTGFTLAIERAGRTGAAVAGGGDAAGAPEG